MEVFDTDVAIEHFSKLCLDYNKCVFNKKDISIAKAKLEEGITIICNICHLYVWINYGQTKIEELDGTNYIHSFDVLEDEHDSNSLLFGGGCLDIDMDIYKE